MNEFRSFRVLACAVSILCSPASEPETYCIFMQSGGSEVHGQAAILKGDKLVASQPCFEVLDYVPAWRAFALWGTDGYILEAPISGGKCKQICSIASNEVNPNDAVCVSPNGNLIADYRLESSEVVLHRTSDDKVIRSFSWTDLKKAGMPVMKCLIGDKGVVFDSSSNTIFVAFPHERRESQLFDDGTTDSVIISIPLHGGHPRLVGHGAPLGFFSRHLMSTMHEGVYDARNGKLVISGGIAYGVAADTLVRISGGENHYVADFYSKSRRKPVRHFSLSSLRGQGFVRGVVPTG